MVDPVRHQPLSDEEFLEHLLQQLPQFTRDELLEVLAAHGWEPTPPESEPEA